MKEIGVGVIGFGFMGKMHSYGFKTIPLYYRDLPYKFNLVGMCKNTIDDESMKLKQQLGYDFITTDPDEVINRDDIDLITVSVPNIYHKELVLKALSAGKHVYCDKPLATSAAEAEEIVRAEEESDTTTQMVLQYRFYPATMKARELIEKGKLGEIVSFRTVYLHASAIDPDKPVSWKQKKEYGGGGVLLDLGSHVLDLMYYLLGEYDQILADNKVLYDKRPDKQGNMVDVEAEDLALMMVKMKNGGTGTIEASKIATGTNDEIRFEIHGTKGALKFNLMDPNWLEFYDDTRPGEPLGGEKGFQKIECVQRYPEPVAFPGPKFSIGWTRGHVHCLYNFVDSLYNNKIAEPSFADGAYIQYVMEQAYQSAETKEWIKL